MVYPDKTLILLFIGCIFVFIIPIVKIFLLWKVNLFISDNFVSSVSVRLCDVMVVVSLSNVPFISNG